MKDLQELFESLGTDEVKRLAGLSEKKNINPQNMNRVVKMISEVYCAERGIDEAEISGKQMTDLMFSFSTSLSIYSNIIDGYMEIVSGRIKLTDGLSCHFRLTKEGVKHVESIIKK